MGNKSEAHGRPVGLRPGSWTGNLRPSQAARGFTLLEVLIALTVMGITVAVLFYGFSQSARLQMKAHEVMEASRVARLVLADRALLSEATARGRLNGPVDGEPGWFYSLEARASGPLHGMNGVGEHIGGARDARLGWGLEAGLKILAPRRPLWALPCSKS